jgi:threonine/homoserine efflux transporter RhtA
MQEEPRGLLFHWVANMFFAGIALFSGVLFGLEVPKNSAFLIVVVGALILIPVTRRWERTGIQKRQAEAPEEPDGNYSEESG